MPKQSLNDKTGSRGSFYFLMKIDQKIWPSWKVTQQKQDFSILFNFFFISREAVHPRGRRPPHLKDEDSSWVIIVLHHKRLTRWAFLRVTFVICFHSQLWQQGHVLRKHKPKQCAYELLVIWSSRPAVSFGALPKPFFIFSLDGDKVSIQCICCLLPQLPLGIFFPYGEVCATPGVVKKQMLPHSRMKTGQG